jgi:hypothetical protein
MKLEIWHARSQHELPPQGDKAGVVVFIPYGKMLLLRANVVHAGGFRPQGNDGNRRCHLYVYKKSGVQHDLLPSNLYNFAKESDRDTKVRLKQRYCRD